jgi:hypothetical protein
MAHRPVDLQWIRPTREPECYTKINLSVQMNQQTKYPPFFMVALELKVDLEGTS